MNYSDYNQIVKAEKNESLYEGFMWGFVFACALALAAFAYLIA